MLLKLTEVRTHPRMPLDQTEHKAYYNTKDIAAIRPTWEGERYSTDNETGSRLTIRTRCGYTYVFVKEKFSEIEKLIDDKKREL